VLRQVNSTIDNHNGYGVGMAKKEMKKTSEQWNKIFELQHRCKIIDPDGWDRHNFQYSWHEEEITYQEFKERMIRSTCIGMING
jgi:hypothetical protein